jgi:hypothetical protein
MAGATASWGLYFVAYNNVKERWAKIKTSELSWLDFFFCSAVSGTQFCAF